MKRKGELLAIAGVETLIGADVRVKGNLTSEGDVNIDGTLLGNLKTSGSITLGVNAAIQGNLTGRNVTVAGRLVGNISAQEATIIKASGRVLGDITTGQIAIELDAEFKGACNMPLSDEAIAQADKA